ncbi:probable polyol transporter 4 [Corylus avellana]|uniref:probable polyol transporter 4 n=1 Tax=Corylus avellana TaxID=13451 RepID=UPI00286BD994|nr:probable polyol transporter 4 [Corylus avellana]
MGLVGVQENGNGEMGLSVVPLGTKNKYRRMDSELTEDVDDASHHHHQENRSKSTRRFVFASAVFASLNSVLLGYALLTWMSIAREVVRHIRSRTY